MSMRVILAACAGAGLVAALMAGPPPVDAAQTAALEPLSWLAGCWAGDVDGRGYREQWSRPAGGMMLGTSQTISGERTVVHEFLQIVARDEGVYYVAKPSGQAQAEFKLVAREDRTATFENPTHDFPQRIIYSLDPGGSLVARVEGNEAGQLRGLDFRMRRTSCD